MIKFTDRANIGQVKTTLDGYVIAQARALRSGVQVYRASELGIVGDHFVKVYRPEDSVFDKDSVNSLAHAPVTIDHPDKDVTSENWKDLAVGEVSKDFLRDGEYLAANIFLKDKRAIDAVNSGKAELSAGYTAEMRPSDNPEYDFIMGPPKYNHLAIVDAARAGSQARIGDNAINWGASPQPTEKETRMTDLIKVMVGDKAVQVAATDADFIAKMVKDHQAALDAKDEQIGSLKAECADANAKVLSDEAIDALVKDRADALARREAVRDKFGDDAVKDASDAEIKGIYSVMDSMKKDDPVRKALADAKPNGDDPWKQIIDKYKEKRK